MARKWTVVNAVPDQDGMILVKSEQKLEGKTGNFVEYGVFGEVTNAATVGAWQKYVTKLDPASDAGAKAYDKWVYGQDLTARQKSGGPADPTVAFGKEGARLNLVDGSIAGKDGKPLAGAPVVTLEQRVGIINGSISLALSTGLLPTKGVTAAADALVAAKMAERKGDTLVVLATQPPAPTAPEPPAPEAPKGKNGGKK